MPATGSYSGPDRRALTAGREDPGTVRRVLIGSALFLLVWVGLVVLARGQTVDIQRTLLALARSFAGAFFLAAGALQLANWRIVGTAGAALITVALVTLGVAFPLFVAVSYIEGDTDLIGSDRLIVDAVLVGLAGYGLVAPEVVSRLRPVRLIVPIIVGYILVGGVSIAVAPVVDAQSAVWLFAPAVGEAIAGAVWVALALGYLVSARRRSSRSRRSRRWLAAAFALLAASALVRAVSGTALSGLGFRAGAQLLAALVAASLAASRLWHLQNARGTRTLALSGELDDARSSLSTAERERSQRLHDAQTAILAVAGATRLLGRPDSVASIDTARLQQLVDAELARLGAILDPAAPGVLRRFQPTDVIEPLVLAHTLAGARIQADLAPVHALGRPEATATAVANLLANARSHAPGSTVFVSVREVDSSIVLVVEDDGPGIPSDERDLVLRRGVRGRRAGPGGHGLGLPAAAEAMVEQGGSLTISERDGGGLSVILTLRSAGLHSAPALPESIQAEAEAEAAAVADRGLVGAGAPAGPAVGA